MILSPKEMAEAEQQLLASEGEAELLMDEAGEKIAAAIRQFFASPGTVVAFAGNGHNGGDALVAARHLKESGWDTRLQLAGSTDSLKPLTGKKLEQLGPDARLWNEGDAPRQDRPLILLDGLLGIGAAGELRPAYRKCAETINRLRELHGAHTFAIDIPSGIDGMNGTPCPGAVMADFTLSIAYPKTGLLNDAATANVGRLVLVPLPAIRALPGQGDPNAVLITPEMFVGLLPRRPFEMHKGQCGHVAIIGGSPGLSGAAILAAQGALRGGAGLVTILARRQAHPALCALAPPEVMVREIDSYSSASDPAFDVLVIGPGLGSGEWDPEVLDLLLNDPRPVVTDADALNLLARNDPAAIAAAPGERLLTPHPGEMQRLNPLGEESRRARAEAFAARTKATVLLKGARTVIAQPGISSPTAFNPTGNPGMATGGVGDTLSGLCAALAATGVSLYHAACAGSWINGRAAEIAVFNAGGSPQSLIASDLPAHYGVAFTDLATGSF
ncbi:MAG: NAD(P)H-hydrate dehydratase [Verrucomicrobiales bacterium]